MENPNNPNNQMMMNNGAIKKMEDNGKMILIRKKIRTAMQLLNKIKLNIKIKMKKIIKI